MVSNDNLCHPGVFGYSKEEGLLVFPEFQYPEWTNKLIEPVPEIIIDLDKNTFEVKWRNRHPYYIIDESPKIDYLYNFEDT